MKRILLIALLLLTAYDVASAQQVVNGRATNAAPSYANATAQPLSLDANGNLRVAVGAAITGTVTANQGGAPWSQNTTQLGGVAINLGSGTIGTGTQRIVIATDQPQLTNALKVDGSAVTQPVSGTVTANQGGAPWSFNQTQINGVALLAGNGATGTGSPRVTIANDSSAIAAWGLGATGAAVPTGAQMTGVRTGANMDALVQAGSSAAISVSTATTTQIVALAASQKIYVTSFDVIAGGTGNITFVYGTGASCGTGTTSLTGAYPLTAQAGIAKGNGLGPVLIVPAGNALCVTTSAAVQMSGSVSYAQF